MKICATEYCNNTLYCKNLCRSCYNKQYRKNNIKNSIQYNFEYKKLHKEESKIYNKQYAETDNGRFIKAKTKAKSRKLEFLLTFDQFLEISSTPCFYCSDKLCGKKNYQGAHLDRIDNSKGYIIDNVISCGLLCNQIRMNNLSVEETKDAVCGILSGRIRRQKKWYVYILNCSKDNTLYTGVSNDLENRIRKHNEGVGAKYTRGRGPFTLLKSFECESKSEALKLEYKIKQLSREEKLKFNEKKRNHLVLNLRGIIFSILLIKKDLISPAPMLKKILEFNI